MGKWHDGLITMNALISFVHLQGLVITSTSNLCIYLLIREVQVVHMDHIEVKIVGKTIDLQGLSGSYRWGNRFLLCWSNLRHDSLRSDLLLE